MNNELIIVEAKDKSISIPVKVDSETVWLDFSSVAKFATLQNEGNRHVCRDIEYYNQI